MMLDLREARQALLAAILWERPSLLATGRCNEYWTDETDAAIDRIVWASQHQAQVERIYRALGGA